MLSARQHIQLFRLSVTDRVCFEIFVHILSSRWRLETIAIVTDSNSGITQDKAKELGIRVIPMPFDIDNVTYLEDIDLSSEEFYIKLETGAEIATSQPSIDYILKLWDELLSKHDKIVHIPMSRGLSGSCDTALVLAKDYNGKVQVVNNQRISVTQRQSVLDAISLVEAGKTAEEIKDILEKSKYDSSIYITLDTLKYLKKGGRVTPAAAALATFLRIKPVLQIQGEKLDAFAKARTLKQAKSMMMQAIKKDIETRFGGDTEEKGVLLQIAHTNNLSKALELKEELLEFLPGYEVYVDSLSLSVSCHIGPGSLAIACTKKLVIE